MAHSIQALVARDDALLPLPMRFERARLVPLAQGYSMLPLTAALVDDLTAAYPGEPEEWVDGFLRYGRGVRALMRELSENTPVAYVETAYVDGVGTQAAAAFRAGEAALEHGASDEPGPINAALRLIGVRPGTSWDEFAAIGLFRYRNMDEWER